MLGRSKQPTHNSSFSEFIRNASAAEKKRVYKEVLERATERQKAQLQKAPCSANS